MCLCVKVFFPFSFHLWYQLEIQAPPQRPQDLAKRYAHLQQNCSVCISNYQLVLSHIINLNPRSHPPKNSNTTINVTNIQKTSQSSNLYLQKPQTQIMTKDKPTHRFHENKHSLKFPRKSSAAATNIMSPNTKQQKSCLARDVAGSI